MPYWRHFTKEEVRGLHPALVARLDEAREQAGTPFVLTSTLRTPEDAAALGTPDSAHVSGWAVDIRAHSSRARFLIIRALVSVGFTRLGIYSSHVHVDADPTKPEEVAWLGVSK